MISLTSHLALLAQKSYLEQVRFSGVCSDSQTFFIHVMDVPPFLNSLDAHEYMDVHRVAYNSTDVKRFEQEYGSQYAGELCSVETPYAQITNELEITLQNKNYPYMQFLMGHPNQDNFVAAVSQGLTADFDYELVSHLPPRSIDALLMTSAYKLIAGAVLESRSKFYMQVPGHGDPDLVAHLDDSMIGAIIYNDTFPL